MLKPALTHFSEIAADPLDELWSVTSCDALLNRSANEIEPLLDRYAVLMHRIGTAAADCKLDGLQFVSARVTENLQVCQHEERALYPVEADLLSGLAELLLGYVMSEGDSEAGEALIQHLAQAGWASPLSVEDASALRNMLIGTSVTQEEPGACVAENSQVSTETAFAPQPSQPLHVQKVDGEMLSMLGKEFGRMDNQLVGDLAAIVDPQLSADGRREALRNYVELLERLASAANSIEMTALGAVFVRLAYSLSAIEALHPDQNELLKQLPARVAAYLTAPTDESASAALVDLLATTAWSAPVGQNAVQRWVESLVNIEIVANEKQQTERQSHATAEDVSIALPDDINPELLDGLLQELPVQTAAFTSAIERLATGQGSGKDVERAMRAAHTLKGAANTVGVRGIANLTHHIEDILLALAEAEAMPDRTLANVLTNAGDCLEAMSEALMGVGSAPEQALEVLQEILDNANRIDREGVSAAIQSEFAAQPEKLMPQGKPETPPLQVNVLRVPAPVVDEMLRLAGETLISNSQIQERLRLTSQQAGEIKRQLHSFQQLVAELEHLVDVRGVAAPEQEMRDKRDFDPLEFEHFSELHTVTRRLVEAVV